MGENEITIRITTGAETGDVHVFVNNIPVGMLKEISMRAVARKGKEPLVSFKASRLEFPAEKDGMVSEFTAKTYETVDSFIDSFLDELPSCGEASSDV